MAHSVHSIKRVDSSQFITELVFEDPESTSVQTVKHSLSEKEGIPRRQRRLSFPLSPSKAGTSWDSFPDQIRNELDVWQAIVYANGKALGRLVQPSFTCSTPQESIQSFEFTFDTFYYAKAALSQSSSSALSFPVDTAFVTSDYTIQLFGRCGSESFALPFRYRVSGREAATKVSLQQQKVAYIQKHKELRRKKQNKDAPVIPVQDIAISCDIHKELASENRSDMEAVLHSNTPSTTEPKTKDFNTCKDNSMGKVNVSRGKKQKKKTKKVIKNAHGGSSSSYDRLHTVTYSHDYTAVPSNRHRPTRMGSDSLSDEKHMIVVEELMQSITQRKGTDHGGDVSEKQSADSSCVQDGETFRDASSSENTFQTSPMKTESESGGPPDHEARRVGEDAQKALAIAFNDFEEEDVYIRRNRSVGSLVRSGSGVLPASSGADATVALSAAPLTQATEHLTQNKPVEKQGWRFTNGLPSSPTTSPHRLNFRSADGLLQSNGDGRNTMEDPSTVMSQANGHTRVPGSVYPNGLGEAMVEHYSQGNEIEQGYQRAAFQALLQMGSPNQSMISMNPQVAAHLAHPGALGNLQMSLMGHPPASIPHLYSLGTQQQVLQGHHPVLSNASNLPPLHGVHLGALLTQDPSLRSAPPEPMRKEEFRKPKDDFHEDSACPYMKPTNDLDRFLTEATPMLQLDPTLDPQKALDQLTLADVWKFYYDCSMLGKEIPLHGSASSKENHCGPCTAYYLPYLSGIQIFTPEERPYGADVSNVFLCDVDGWPSFMRMQYEQFEVNPPWFRLPLYDMMDELSLHVPELKQLKLKDLHPASWFCVAWYPLYRIPDAPLGTRFLTFHSFHPSLRSTTTVGRGGSVPLAVYGLEWYNMLDELWLDNIRVTKPIRSPSPPKNHENGRYDGVNGGEVYSAEQHHWMLRIKELRHTAKTFARGLGFRRSTPHGIADANTHHHDFEYFYERN